MKLLACSILILGVARGQQFDVATIKPNTENDNRMMMRPLPGGGFTASGVTLKQLIMQAYDIVGFQLTGEPRWVGTDRWDVQARAEGFQDRIPLEPERAMLRALLADRFQLKVHGETREMPVYGLVLAKNGPKLAAVADPAKPPGLRQGPGSLRFTKSTIAMLARQLGLQLGRNVIDKTGLAGVYDFALEWTPEPGQGGGPEAFGFPPGTPGPSNATFNGPSIYTAVQEQLGLRLDSQRGPAEVLVVDFVDKPSAN